MEADQKFNMEFSEQHYVPVLKWKRGEARALKDLDPAVKAACTPLVEVVPVPTDPETGAAKKTLSKHLDDAIAEMKSSWGTAHPVFVDIRLLPPNQATGATLTGLFDRLRAAAILAIPVISTGATQDILQAAAGIHKKDRRGVCLREGLDAVMAPAFPVAVSKALLATGVTQKTADVVIDMQDVSANKTTVNAALAASAIGKVPNLKAWRTFTIVATAFPLNLSGIAPGVHTLPRAEWALWKALGSLPRRPTYGDYAVAHWDLQELDPRVILISASIRYTSDDEWVIFRGRNVKNYGFGQFTALSKLVVKHPAYCGSAFSAGDDYIAACASGTVGSGNHETWRRVATNHHITFVVDQLSKLALGASVPAAPASGAASN
ncbi:conserved hypothetical protein [Anaeromyxobacter dehalogenans 2CP-1]|uniref:Beta protein n=1 Tax=Anaeromyxobacter dehalogenans (strain ATCC BAA-258 / DSM 21875 / 2CP-1) TaxID=455488 RepID=B8J6W4_ANAD2|nr:beta family protein [Anaeromyxobacter dehalogenans]ACL67086.1 conserved hypothetical protein [Anaeromyxobacter dehalogenans 2CP-1]